MPIRGRSMPIRRSASAVRSMTRRSRAGVSFDGASASATWVETWLTRNSPCASIITGIARAGQVREHVGVPGIGIAGEVERLLVQGRGDDGGDRAGHRVLDGAGDCRIGELARGGGDRPHLYGRGRRADIDDRDPRPCRVVGDADRLDRQSEPMRHVEERAPRAVDHRQDAGRSGTAADFPKGLQGYFRADAGRIAHRDAQTHL